MRLPLGWLKEFVDAPSDVRLVADKLGAAGFEVAGIEGDVIDLEITANRPDCLTIVGLAREVATAFDLELKGLAAQALAGKGARGPREDSESSSAGARAAGDGAPAAINKDALPVTIQDPRCGRFALALVDVTVGPSPAWMAERLNQAGVRPINNIVDVTNYVMLELHPMHAFDAAKLAGPELQVRAARAGEKLVTLDGQTRALDAQMLVVADRDQAVSIAGVMGGAGSEVSSGTKRIALEAAWWQPAQVRSTSRKLSLKTEAAARFERGADIEGPVRAIARALELFEKIGAGRAAGPTLDVYPQPESPRTVALRRDYLHRLLGDKVPDQDIVRILSRLGFGVQADAAGWRVLVPLFRVDVRREADLIEEVGRHWGFDRIPATFPSLHSAPPPLTPAIASGRKARRVLTGAGLQEATTFTFVEEAAARPFVADPSALVAIANPLSEKFSVQRPSLLPGLLDALIYNRNRESADIRLFETGSIFSSAGERHAVAWVLTGRRGTSWDSPSDSVDLLDAKGLAELLAGAFGASIQAEHATLPWFVPGRSAQLTAVNTPAPVILGVFGQLQPSIAAARGAGPNEIVIGGEIDLRALVAAGQGDARRVTPLPRFPSIVRDLSMLVDERLPAAAVRGTIRASAPPTLASVREFDRYRGRGVPAGQVSLSMRLTFRAGDRTLTDAEVQDAVGVIVAALSREHGVVLRGT